MVSPSYVLKFTDKISPWRLGRQLTTHRDLKKYTPQAENLSVNFNILHATVDTSASMQPRNSEHVDTTP